MSFIERSNNYNLVLIIGPCLYESGIIPKKLTFREDAELLKYGIGITNIVPRTTRAANELNRQVSTSKFIHYYVVILMMKGWAKSQV